MLKLNLLILANSFRSQKGGRFYIKRTDSQAKRLRCQSADGQTVPILYRQRGTTPTQVNAVVETILVRKVEGVVRRT